MKVFTAYSMKGGVGKTTAAVNLAYCSSLEGRATLIWDLDPQGVASYYFRVKAKVRGGSQRLLEKKKAASQSIKATDFGNLDLLPADFSNRNLDLLLARAGKPHRNLARVLRVLGREYDRIFLDCPPGLSLLSETVLGCTDVLLLPTIPTILSMRTVFRLLEHVRSLDRKPGLVLPFFSMIDRRKALHRDICDGASEQSPGFLQQGIPFASQVEQMGIHRCPIGVFAPHEPATEAFANLWQEIRELTGVDTRSGLKRTIRSVRTLLRETRPTREQTGPEAEPDVSAAQDPISSADS